MFHKATLALLVALPVAVQTAKKPVLIVEKDGLPSGHSTPEGAACDLARAFINKDVSLFGDICIRPFGGGSGREQYETFIRRLTGQMMAEPHLPKPSPRGPKSIEKVYAARSLSKSGPASYAHATFGFKDVKFVDVVALLHNGKKATNRTFVIQDAKGKWYVDPLPTASPLLSDGLNQVSMSTVEIGAAYQLKKK